MKKRLWLLLVLLAVLVAAHGAIFYRLGSRLTWAVALVVLLVVLAHSGIFASVYAIFGRHFKHKL